MNISCLKHYHLKRGQAKTLFFLYPTPPPLAPFLFLKSGNSVKTFIRNLYKLAKRCEELICAELT